MCQTCFENYPKFCSPYLYKFPSNLLMNTIQNLINFKNHEINDLICFLNSLRWLDYGFSHTRKNNMPVISLLINTLLIKTIKSLVISLFVYTKKNFYFWKKFWIFYFKNLSSIFFFYGFSLIDYFFFKRNKEVKDFYQISCTFIFVKIDRLYKFFNNFYKNSEFKKYSIRDNRNSLPLVRKPKMDFTYILKDQIYLTKFFILFRWVPIKISYYF